MCTPPLISQDVSRVCLVYATTTTTTCSVYCMNAIKITLFLFSRHGQVILSNGKSHKSFYAILMFYRQLHFNSFNVFLVQYLQHLFFTSEFDCLFFLMLIFHKNVTACLLHDWLTFLCIVIFPGPNIKMNMSPFQFSLTYGSYCHHWFRSVIHYAIGIHFFSGHHHIYKDETDNNRFYYLMDHSLTNPLITNIFFKLRQTITVTCMPVSLTYIHKLPYSNITNDSLTDELLRENNLHDGQTLALDIVLDIDHLDYSTLGNIDSDINIRDNRIGGGVSMFINNMQNFQEQNDIILI